MRLLVVGNSPKLIRFIESIFPISEKRIIGWRSLPLTKDEVKDIAAKCWDILLVAGYDYQTAACNLDECLAKNVRNVMTLVNTCVGRGALVVYANTKAPTRKYTWSRYLYAKMLLGDALLHAFPNTHNLEFPTIVESGRILTTGGALSKFAFRLLDFLGCLSKVTINESAEENLKLFNELKVVPSVPKAVMLVIPRPLIFDRFLRLIFG